MQLENLPFSIRFILSTFFINMFFLAGFLSGEELDITLRFDPITSESGITSTVTYSMLQDSKGFLWFGGEVGLNRYDGYEFRNYRNDPTDSTSLNEEFLMHISEDSFQNLWLSSRSGLTRFDPRTEVFHNLVYDSSFSKISSLNIHKTLPLPNNKLLIFSRLNGPQLFLLHTNPDGSEKSVENITSVLRLESPDSMLRAVDVSIDQRGQVWICDFKQGIFKLDIIGKSLSKLDLYDSDRKKLSYSESF
ncbi:MAG: two-component regulator propeller domain-containing protein, partial [Calditrichota bacterium]